MIALAMGFGTTPSTADALADEPAVDPWGAAWLALGSADPAWQAWRVEAGLGTAPLPLMVVGVERRIEVVAAVLRDGWLADERALLDAAADAGLVDPVELRGWRALFDALEAGAAPDAWQPQVLRLSLLGYGATVAVLPATCLPTDPDARAALETLALAEAAVPAGRSLAHIETPPLPVDTAALDLGVDGDAGDAFALAGAALAAVGALDRTPPIPHAAVCDAAIPALAARAGTLDRDAFAAARPALEALWAVSPPPPALAVRVAIGRYLQTDAPSLEALAAWEATARGADAPSAIAAAALAAGARQRSDTFAERAEQLAGVDSTWARWVRAEARRLSDDAAGALSLANDVLDADPQFAPALLTRASALVMLGQGQDAQADLVHLRRTFDGVSPYARWIEALAVRLR